MTKKLILLFMLLAIGVMLCFVGSGCAHNIKVKETEIVKDIEMLEYEEEKLEAEKALAVIIPENNKRAVMALRKHLDHPVLISFMNSEGVTEFGITSYYYKFLETEKITVDILGYTANEYGTLEQREIEGRNLKSFIEYILLSFDQKYVNVENLKTDFETKIIADYDLLLQMELD